MSWTKNKYKNFDLALALNQSSMHSSYMTNTKTAVTIDLGNNESLTRGVFKEADGTFTALTFTRSKNFKTQAGAVRWFKKATGQA